MPLTSLQKDLVTQFVQLSGVTDKTAQRYLKSASYNLNVAIDNYFAVNGVSSSASVAVESTLEKMFDGFWDHTQDDRSTLGAESTMKYIISMGANPENCEFFVVMDIVRASGFGQIKKAKYVEGWKATGAQTTLAAHKKYVRERIEALSCDPAYFKQIYRSAFTAGKEAEQKALPLENALVFWDMLFSEDGRPWKTASTDWLQSWKQYLSEKWTRSVNKDMWYQTLDFATKSMDDETLSFWSEDGAWPGVIDDFVVWCREHGISKIQREERGEGMDLDDY